MTGLEDGLPRAGEIAPVAAEEIALPRPRGLPEQTDSLVEMAIESVLEQVPEVPGEAPEANVKYQPWADTAAPPGKNKRPLEELLAEYAARVAADPDARAGHPQAKPPGLAWFDRFGPRRDRPGGPRGRRSGRGGRQPQPAGAGRPERGPEAGRTGAAPGPPGEATPGGGSRRRRRSGRRRRHPGGGGPPAAG